MKTNEEKLKQKSKENLDREIWEPVVLARLEESHQRRQCPAAIDIVTLHGHRHLRPPLISNLPNSLVR